MSITVENKRSVYRAASINRRDVVLIGDSLVDFGLAEFGSTKNWRNRGIGGATTEVLLNSMGDLTAGEPAAAYVVWCGVNDIMRGWPAERTQQNLDGIAAYLREKAPEAEIIFISPAPAEHAKFAAHILTKRPNIIEPTLELIDPISEHMAELGQVIELPQANDLTVDGLHYSGEALRMVAMKIERRLSI